ncbi:MAG: ArsR family transcriptional regulator [Microbacteriaceae bacterium]|nr:ArsR family transcriptional regulator [Microbacteriaceae bacterium]
MGANEYPMPSTGDIRLADVLHCLSDPSRVKILISLADGEFHRKTVDSFSLNVQKSTMSHHLRTMREAGLTETRMTGRDCDIRLRVADLDARFPGLIAALTSESAVNDLANDRS